jgi:hypothetical protein
MKLTQLELDAFRRCLWCAFHDPDDLVALVTCDIGIRYRDKFRRFLRKTWGRCKHFAGAFESSDGIIRLRVLNEHAERCKLLGPAYQGRFEAECLLTGLSRAERKQFWSLFIHPADATKFPAYVAVINLAGGLDTKYPDSHVIFCEEIGRFMSQ